MQNKEIKYCKCCSVSFFIHAHSIEVVRFQDFHCGVLHLLFGVVLYLFCTFITSFSCPFPFKGLLGGIFHFHSKTLLSALSDQSLNCLHMSHKKDTRLLWVTPF